MTPNQGDNQDQQGGQRRGQPQGQPPQRRPQRGPQPGQQGPQQRGIGGPRPQAGGQPQSGGRPQTGGQPQGGGHQQQGGGHQQQGGRHQQQGGIPGQPGQRGAQGATPQPSPQSMAGQPGAGGQQQPLGQMPGAGTPQPMAGQPGVGGPGGQPSPPMAGQPGMGGPGAAAGRRRPGMRPQLQSVTIEDIVETDVVTAEQDTPVATVVAEMAEQDVGSVVVVEDDRPQGVLTDRTICLALEDDPQVTERSAGELVSGDLLTATTDDSVFDAIKQMGDKDVRRLPIVDEDGTLEGIVTLDDILVLLGAELHNAVEIIREQSPRI